MVPRCARAAALAALAACLGAAAPAQAQAGVLVAQMAQTQPEGRYPPLTDAPEGLRGSEPEPEPEPEPTPEAPEPEPGDAGNGGDAGEEEPGAAAELPETGTEPLPIALAGLGLLAAGFGLRRSADDLVGP